MLCATTEEQIVASLLRFLIVKYFSKIRTLHCLLCPPILGHIGILVRPDKPSHQYLFNQKELHTCI